MLTLAPMDAAEQPWTIRSDTRHDKLQKSWLRAASGGELRRGQSIEWLYKAYNGGLTGGEGVEVVGCRIRSAGVALVAPETEPYAL